MKLSRLREIFHAIQGILNYDLKPVVEMRLRRALQELQPHADVLNAQMQELRVGAETDIAQKQAAMQAELTAFITARKAAAEAEITQLMEGEVEVKMPVFAEADLLDSKQVKQILVLLPPLLEFVQETPTNKSTP